jgi:Co/Zn/Cd efflux system component
MDKSLFNIPKMDCAAEEQLVRMKLEGVDIVRGLEADLAGRNLTVYHEGGLEQLQRALDDLNLGAMLRATQSSDETLPEQGVQRNLLWLVFAINFGFFVLELTTGLLFRSMGLVADSLDMLADALVYGLSLLAVGSTAARKKNVARWSGYFQLALAAFGFLEVVRRFLGFEALPDFRVMIVVSFLALLANSICLYLLQRSRSQEAHMKASMIFTSNDVIINIGVIVAGILVSLLDSSMPDLVVGAVVFIVVSRGAFKILRLAK